MANVANPWDNVDIPRDQTYGGVAYPFCQWWNGQKAFARVHPVLSSGGWAIPMEQLSAVENVPDMWTPGELPHKDGSSTPAVLAAQIGLAVIMTRFHWVVRGERGPVVVPEYVDGAKGKVQALCVIKGLSMPTPMMITVSGMAGKHLGQVVRTFRTQIIAPASALKKQAMPLYTFWMPVKAGPAVNVGQSGKQSPITPPVAGWDQEAVKDPAKRLDLLRKLFVGAEVVAFCAEHWQEAQEWAQAKAPQQSSGMPDDNGDELPPPPEDDEIPF